MNKLNMQWKVVLSFVFCVVLVFGFAANAGEPITFVLTNHTATENTAPGTFIGELQLTSETLNPVYSLPSGQGDNEEFSITGTSLFTAGVFDYEEKSAFSVVVDAVGDDESAGQETFTIDVINMPPVAENTSISVPEDAFVSGSLPVTGDTTHVSFSLSGEPGLGAVDIDPATGAYTYTPDADVNGEDSFDYSVSDGVSEDTGTVSVTITAKNDFPVIQQGETETLTCSEDGEAVDLLLSATDVDHDTLVWSVSSPASHGLASVEGTGSVSYTPQEADYYGYDVFAVMVEDGHGGIDSIMVTVTVSPVNDAPTFTVGNDVVVDEDCGTKMISGWIASMSAGAPNESAQTITFSVTNNTNAALFAAAPAVDSSGTLTFEPADDAFGTAVITLSAKDSEGLSCDETQNFSITVNSINDVPVCTGLPNITGTAHNGETLSVSRGSWNDDIDGDYAAELTFEYQWQSTDALEHEWSAIGGASTSQYTLTQSENGLYIRVKVTCTEEGAEPESAVAYASAVLVLNQSPVFVLGDSTTMAFTEDAASANVALEATDADGDTLTYSVSQQPTLGTVDLSGSTAAYSPAANANGTDSFAVDAADGNDGTATITVNVTIDPVNDPPSFSIGLDQIVNEDCGQQTVGSWIPSMSAGPANESSQTLIFQVETNSNPALFAEAPAISANGTLQYTPAANAFGSADIAVSLHDSENAYADGNQTFRITVNPVNDAPVNTEAPAVSGTLHNGQLLTASAGSWNDTLDDTQATSLTYAYQWQSAGSASGPWNDISGAAGNTYTLTSAENDLYIRIQVVCTDTDEIPLSATAYSAPGQVLNADPVIGNGETQALSATEDGEAVNFQLEFSDSDGDECTVRISQQGTKGSASISESTISYTPDEDKNGSDSFTVSVEDANGGSDVLTVNVSIEAQNDVPSFTIGLDQTVDEDCGTQTEDGWITVMSPGPDDESGQTLSFHVQSNTNESLFSAGPAVSSNGTLSYTPATNANGQATVMVYIADSEGASSEAQSFVITVNPVNDIPVNTVLPTVSGTLAVGNTLTGHAGTWEDSADSNTLDAEDFSCSWQTATNAEGAGLQDAESGWTYTLSAEDAHLYVRIKIEVTDTDAAGTQTAQAYSNWVAIGNTNPEIQNASPEIATDEDTNGHVTLTATDADSDTLTWTVSLPASHGNAVVDEASGAVTYTPDADYNGSDEFTVSVSDGYDGTDSVLVSATVHSVNDIPTFTIGANQEAEEDCGAQTVDPFIETMSPGPADESNQTLSFHVTDNSNSGLFAVLPSIGNDGVLSFEPADDAYGSAEITVSVSDSAEATNETTQSFIITVNSVNDAPRNTGLPVISGVPHNGKTLSVTHGTWSDDADGANATELVYSYQWQSSSGESGPWSDISGATEANYTLTLAENDLYVRTVVTCADSDTTPASANVASLAVLVTNEDPVIFSEDSPIMLFSEDGDAQTITLEATDADGDTLTWGITEASKGTASVDGGVVSYQPDADENGEDGFTVSVTDGNGGSDTMYFTVLIDAVNDIPTFTIGADQIDTEDDGGQYVPGWIQIMSPGPSDESDQKLSFAVSDITDESLFHTLPSVSMYGTLTYTLAANQNGSTQVSVAVSDDAGATNPEKQIFTITVNPVNDTPSLVTEPVISGTFAADHTISSSHGVWNDDIDDNAGTIAYDYTWYFADDDQGTNAVSETGSASYLLTSTQSHKYVRVLVHVTNEDTSGTTQTQAYTPWYLIENTAPVITEAAPAVTTDEDTASSLTLHATDADDDTLTWSVSLPAGHGAAEINASTGAVSYTPALNYRGGDEFTVRVKDADNDFDEVTVSVTVDAVNDVPLNTVLPSVSGTHQYGYTLTASEGTWTDDADDNLATLTYGYQWQRASDDQGTGLTNIAEGSTYEVTATESHQYVRVLVTVTDTDDSGTVQPQAASVWTYIENTNPVITEISPSMTTNEDTVQTLTLHATDVDADTLSWAVTSQGTRGSAVIGESTGLIIYTPQTDNNGSDSIEVTVTDGHNGHDSVVVDITITPVNDIPSFTVGSNITSNEDSGDQTVPGWISVMSKGPANESVQTLSYTVSITEENATDSPSLFAVAPAVSPDGTLTYTPAQEAYGLATMSIYVTDNGGGDQDTSEAQSFTITIKPVNDPPVITGLASVETPEDTPYVYGFTLKDVEDGPDNLDIAYATDNTALLEKGSMVLGGSGANRTLTVSTVENRSGSVNITLTITDSQGGHVIKTVVLDVTAVNDPPTISTIADRTTYEDTSTGAIGFTIGDIDTAVSSCTVTAVSANTALVPNDTDHITVSGTTANRTISILPAQDANGTADITLTVSDGELTAETTFTLTVDATNDKPTISSIADITIDEDHNTGAIAFTVNDIDNPMSELSISAAANNTALVPKSNIVLSTIDGDGKATVTVTPVHNYNGTSTITVTVKDTSGALSSEAFLLTVNPVNDPPTMSAISNQSANEDTVRAFNVYIGDIDTSTSLLTLTATESTNTALLPLDDEHISITGSTGTRRVELKPLADQNGTTTITLQVSDGGETVATRQFDFTVNAVNDTPYFTVGEDVNVSEDAGSQTLTNWATGISAGADNESEGLTFHLQADMAAMFAAQPAIDENGTLTFTPADNANGVGTITVSLSDAGGATSGAATFHIDIASVNDIPVAYDMTTGLDTDEDQQLKGSLSIYDPDKDTMTFELVSGEDHNVTTFTTASGGQITLDASAGTFVYVPYKDYFEGPDSFSFRVFDGTVYSNDAQVTIELTGINDPPVAEDGALIVDEDAADAAGSLAGLVNDVDNVSLIYSIVSNPNQGGVITLSSSTGDYTYTAPADYFGTERFTFRAYDGATYSNTATVTITINPVNDAPVAQDETIHLDEGKTVSGKFKATDIEQDTIIYSIDTPPASGTLTLLDAATGAYSFTPAAMTTEETVTAIAKFKAADPSGGFTLGTITIIVRNINDAPYVDDLDQLSVITAEDTTLNGSVAAVDPDEDTLVYTVLNNVNHGTLSFNTSTGSYTYTPHGNYNGTDYFTFIAKEDSEEDALSTGIYRVSITVTPVNDAPYAYDLYYYTDAETPITLSPVGYDIDSGSLTYSIESVPVYGALADNGNNTFTYTPNGDATGVTDTILYKAIDGSGGESDNATMYVHIYGEGPGGGLSGFSNVTIPQNTSTDPIAINVSGITIESVQITSSNTWLLSNDYVNDIVITNNSGNYSFVLTPNEYRRGRSVITVRVTDNENNVHIRTFVLTVTHVYYQPTANDMERTIDENTEMYEYVSGSDLNGDWLSFSTQTSPSHGDLEFYSNGTFYYKPTTGYSGDDSFTFIASNAEQDSEPATVTIHITNVPSAPSADNAAFTTPEDTAITDVLTGYSPEAAEMVFHLVSNGTLGTAVVNANGTFTYTPDENVNGTDVFTFKTEGPTTLYSSIATVTVTITPVNDQPVADAKTVSTFEDQDLQGYLTASDADENDTLSYSLVETEGTLLLGSVTLNAETGQYTYKPAQNANGTDTFYFRAYDGTVYSEPALITVEIEAQNDAPTVEDSAITVGEDSSKEGALSTLFEDVDGDTQVFSTLQEPEKGTISFNEDGTFTYTPDANKNGMDYFSYRTQDPSGLNSNVALVTVTITPENDVPTMDAAAAWSINEDSIDQYFFFTVDDVEDSPDILNMSAVYDEDVIESLVFGGSGNNRWMCVTPVPSHQLEDEDVLTSIEIMVADSGVDNTLTGDVKTASTDVVVTISSVNDTPTIENNSTNWIKIYSTNITIDEDTCTDDFYPEGIKFKVNDEELDILGEDVTVTASATNEALVPDSGIVVSQAGETRTIKITPAADQYGTTNIYLYASDGNSIRYAYFTLVVRPVNDAPVITPPDDLTIAEDGNTGDLYYSISDIDSTITNITVTQQSGDESLVIPSDIVLTGNAKDRVVNITPLPNQNGDVTITLTADDHGAVDNIGSASFVLHVLAVNDTPTIEAIENVTILEDGVTAAIPVNVADIDDALSVLGLTAISGNPSLVDGSGIAFSKDAETGQNYITLTPKADQNGAALITVKVTDEGGKYKTTSFTLNVTPVNDPPTISAVIDQTILEDGRTQAITFNVADIDNDVLDLTVAASSDDTGVIPVSRFVFTGNGGERTVTITPLSDQNGDIPVALTVQDPGGLTDTSPFTVYITPVNDEPSFTGGSDQTVLEDCELQTVPAWATSISKGPANEAYQELTFHLTNDNNALFTTEGQPAMDASGQLTYTPVDDMYGSATVTVYLTDNGGTDNGGDDTSDNNASADIYVDTFTITVRSVNDRPVFAALDPEEDIIVDEDSGVYENAWADTSTLFIGPENNETQTYNFYLTMGEVHVAGNDVLFSENPTINSQSGEIRFIPAVNANGTAEITVVLKDNDGTDFGGQDTSVEHTFTITVRSVNDDPTFTLGPNITVDEDSGLYSETLATGISTGGGDDEAGQILTFTLDADNKSLFSVQPAMDPNGVLIFTPADDQHGSATVSVVLDDETNYVNGSFTITVNSVNDAPTFVYGSAQTVWEDCGIQTVPGWGTDMYEGADNEDSQTLHFDVSALNPSLFTADGLPALSTNGTLTFTPAENANGESAVSLYLIDDGGTAFDGVDRSYYEVHPIIVLPVNDQPSFTDLGEIEVDEDSGTYDNPWIQDGSISVGPANEASQGYSFYMVENVPARETFGNDDLFSTEPAIDPASGDISFTPAENANGSATFTVYLQDNGGTDRDGVDTSVGHTLKITVGPVNDDPAYTLGGTVTVNEDSGAYTNDTYATGITTGGGTDEAGQTLSFTLTAADTSLFSAQPAMTNTGILTFTPADDEYGVTTVTVVLSDGDNTVEKTFTIAVMPVNDQPSFTDTGKISVDEDCGAKTVAWVSEYSLGPDNEAQGPMFSMTEDSRITWSSKLFSSEPEINPITGALSFTPAANANGSVTYTVTLRDDGGTERDGVDLSQTHTLLIEINAVDDDPTYAIPESVTVYEDSGVYIDTGFATGITTGGGADEAEQTLSFTLSGYDETLFDGDVILSNTGVLLFVPAADVHGSTTVNVSLTDTTNTVEDSFTITIVSVNDQPGFTKGANQTVLEDCKAQTVTAWATDLDKGAANESSQNLMFNVTNDNNTLFTSGGQPAIDSSGTLYYTPADDMFGTAEVTVYLIDDGGTADTGIDTSAVRAFMITVQPVNDQPSFTDNGKITVPEDSGEYSQLWVKGETIDLGPINENQNFAFSMTEIISERETFGNENLFSEGPVMDAATGRITFTPALNASGSVTFTVYLKDEDGTDRGGVDTSIGHQLIIDVTAVNDLPACTLAGDVTVDEDSGAYLDDDFATGITPSGGTDEAGQELTFTLSDYDHSLFSTQPELTADGELSFTPADDVNGSTQVTVTLSDGFDDVEKSFNITIRPVNDAPSFTAGANQTVLEDCGAQTVDNWATDITIGPANESTQTLSVETTCDHPELFETVPSVSLTGVLTYKPKADAFGTATVTVQYTDNGGTDFGGDDNSDIAEFTITIQPVNDRPSFSDNGNITVLEDTEEYSGAYAIVTSLFIGPDNEAQDCTFFMTEDESKRVVNGNTKLFSEQPVMEALTGVISFTPEENAFGSAVFTVYLKDTDGTDNGGYDTSLAHTLKIEITSVDDDPTCTLGDDIIINEDHGSYQSTGFATNITPGGGTDEQSQVLTFTLVSDNEALFSQQPSMTSNGTLTFTPEADAFGTAHVSVELDDGHNTIEDGFDITVQSVNDQPVFTDHGNITVSEDSGNYSQLWVDTASIDPGPSNENREYTFYMTEVEGSRETEGNTILFSGGPAIDAGTGRITFRPALNANGSVEYTVHLKDEDGTDRGGLDTSVSHTLKITVTAVDDTPSFTLDGNVEVKEDCGVQQIADFATEITAGGGLDEKEQELEFTLTAADTTLFSVQPQISENGTLTFTPAPNVFGETTVDVTLSDKNTSTDSQSFTISILSVNDQPGFEDAGDITVLEDSGIYSAAWADNTTRDVGPDNETQTYSYAITQMNVTDDTALFTSDPQIDAGTGEISFALIENAYGSAQVTVVLRDTDGTENGGLDTSENHTFTITVKPVNDQPSFTDMGDLTVNEDSGAVTESWVTDGSISAGPENELQDAVFSLELDETTLVVNGNTELFAAAPVIDTDTGQISFTPAENANGSIQGTVVLTDTQGTDDGGLDASIGHTVLITVNAVNDAPVFTAGEDISVGVATGGYEQENWAQEIAAGPVDEESQTMLFILETDKPELFAVQPAISPEGTLSFTPSEDLSGETTITITLKDDGGTEYGGVDESTKQQFTIQVVSSSDLVLTGTVYSAKTLEPIDGAKVRLIDSIGNEVASATVGADGQYCFTGLTGSNEKLTLIASADGYQENRAVTEVSFDQNISGTITQDMKLSQFNLIVTADPSAILGDGKSTADINVYVYDDEGLPIRGIEVKFTSPSGSFKGNGDTAVTKRDGSCKTTYVSDKLSGTSELQIPITVTVQDEVHKLYAAVVIYERFVPGFVEGVVTERTGNHPVKGAIVTVYKDFDGDGTIDFSDSVVTGANGKYKIAIPKGDMEYNISITRPASGSSSQVTFEQTVPVGSINGGGNEISNPSKSAVGIVKVQGKSDEASKALLEAGLSMEIVGNGKHGDVSLNAAAGTFSANNLSEGTYTLNVYYQHDDGRKIVVGSQQITISNTGETNISEVLIDPYGIITDSKTGKAVSGAQVMLYYASSGSLVSLPAVNNFPPANNANPQMSDGAGEYAFMVYPYTDYYIVATKDGYETFSNKEHPISVGESIVNYNFQMTPLVQEEEEDTDVERTGYYDPAVYVSTGNNRVLENGYMSCTVTYGNKTDQVLPLALVRLNLPKGMMVTDNGSGAVFSWLDHWYSTDMLRREPDFAEHEHEQLVVWLAKDLKPDEVRTQTVILHMASIGTAEPEIEKTVSAEIVTQVAVRVPEDDTSFKTIVVASTSTASEHKAYFNTHPNERFASNAGITRGDAAMVFATILNLSSQHTDTVMKDVSADDPRASAINAMVEAGYMQCDGNAMFYPQQELTRAEFVAMAAKYLGIERVFEIEPLEYHFTDIEAHQQRSTIEEAYRYGILTAFNEDEFEPDQTITRLEAAIILNRMLCRGPLINPVSILTDVPKDDSLLGEIAAAVLDYQAITNDDGSETMLVLTDMSSD